MSIAPGARLGPYEVETLLGSGGMGEVYRATDSRLGRTVAIKVLPQSVADNPTRRERFTREALAIAGLSHPHICALYDVGEQDGHPFLVMEHLEGESLADRLSRGPLALDELLRHGIEISDALDHAHRHGVVHRDLKPANVMLTRTGVKLLDFGLARLQGRDEIFTGSLSTGSPALTESLTNEGTIIGTVQYMAPEQLEAGAVDGRTDIFAFGAVLFEMATGRSAFEGGSTASVMAAVLERTPAPVSTTRASTGREPSSRLLDQIVARCLAKHPDARWQTASDLQQALAWVGDGLSPLPEPTPRRRDRSFLVWTAGGLVLAAAVLAIALMLTRARPASDTRSWRYLVPAPDSASFNPSPTFQALSPDGIHLAFTAAAPQGSTALWIRSSDSVSPRVIPGTVGAYHPLWSPDGRFVAFGAAGALKRMELATGLIETVTEGWFTAASWGSSDTLLLSLSGGADPSGARPLYRVAATGGERLPATTLDPGRSETAHTHPHFLPDGRHFLFLANSTNPEFDGVLYVGLLDSKERVSLFRSMSAASYASGYLLFMQDQTLLGRRFDPTRFTLSGDPVVIASEVDRGGPTGRRGSVSVSQNGILAYRPVRQTQLVWLDRTGRSIGPIAEPDFYRDPSLSPDEQKVAVSRQDPTTNNADIWIIDLTRPVPARFTQADAAERQPLWTPDGTRLAYRSGTSIVWKRSDGAGVEEPLVGNLSGFDQPFSWTHEGRILVYGAFDGKATHIWMTSIAGDRKALPLPATSGNDLQGQVSADGRWLAYASNEAGQYEVYVQRFPTGEDKVAVSRGGGSEPTWRRDGKELFYLAADRSLMAVSVNTTSGLKLSSPARLFETTMSTVVNNTLTRNQYVVTGDGQRFLVNQPAGSPPAIVVVVNWPAALGRSDSPR